MIIACGINFYGTVLEFNEMINPITGIWQMKWRKSSYNLMEERSVWFIIFY